MRLSGLHCPGYQGRGTVLGQVVFSVRILLIGPFAPDALHQFDRNPCFAGLLGGSLDLPFRGFSDEKGDFAEQVEGVFVPFQVWFVHLQAYCIGGMRVDCTTEGRGFNWLLVWF